jgi:hypothetical protein
VTRHRNLLLLLVLAALAPLTLAPRIAGGEPLIDFDAETSMIEVIRQPEEVTNGNLQLAQCRDKATGAPALVATCDTNAGRWVKVAQTNDPVLLFEHTGGRAGYQAKHKGATSTQNVPQTP